MLTINTAASLAKYIDAPAKAHLLSYGEKAYEVSYEKSSGDTEQIIAFFARPNGLYVVTIDGTAVAEVKSRIRLKLLINAILS